MTITIKKEGVIVLPKEIKRKANFKVGRKFDVVFSGGIVNIVPEVPKADDEYTPRQRKIIDASLAKAMKGPYYGPFKSVKEMITDMKTRTKTSRTRRTSKK